MDLPETRHALSGGVSIARSEPATLLGPLHTGECERIDQRVGGIAVDIEGVPGEWRLFAVDVAAER